ncbi:MAG TPA: substrate-binding domain-containing protein, partial [Pedobacter sp.]|nr:substrate-binding domain-containing protein [Pedobacter sp.]
MRYTRYFQSMTMLRIPFLILISCILMVLAGCSGKPEEKEYTIGFSQCVGSDLWRKTMLEEMRMELSLRPHNKLIYADADNSSSRQIEQVRDMLKKGIDILIISPNEAMPLTGIVEEIYKKGIPVVVIDRKTSSSLYTAYIGAENYQVGKMAGHYLVNTLKEKGNILEILGLPGSSPAIERERGLMDAISTHPGIRISGQLYGDWLPEHTARELLRNKD